MAGKTVSVGTATAAPGQVVRGSIPVTTLGGGTPLEIPVVIVNGVADGPCFWVNGAIHGDEPEGPLACQIALSEVDPLKLAGTLVMVPVVNVPAFEAAQRGNPLDTFSYDMNRIYPGVIYGDHTDDFVRLSLTQPVPKIREAIARMKVVVDAIRSESLPSRG